MKHLRIKNLILVVALAVGLGITGIAATAQAAEWSVLSETACDHPAKKWIYYDKLISYDTRDLNIFTHTKYTLIIYKCGICQDFVTIQYEEDEPHDLVYNPSNDRYECTHCDFWE